MSKVFHSWMIKASHAEQVACIEMCWNIKSECEQEKLIEPKRWSSVTTEEVASLCQMNVIMFRYRILCHFQRSPGQ